jgi:esterase/lipase superfamily enzyme
MYGKAIKVANSDKTVHYFLSVIKSLAECGIKRIHLASHSMGARVVTAAAPFFTDIFQTDRSINHQSTLTLFSPEMIAGKVELASVTFINPETPLNSFKNKQFDLIRKHTNVITMYGNQKDVALLSAEHVYCWEPLLGCHVHDLVLGDVGSFHDYERGHTNNSNVMDMDVIDTTELDMNIHAARHSYFNLNKYVLDDMVDIICTGRRAIDREHRLLNIDSNVYGFLSAPSYVVNK